MCFSLTRETTEPYIFINIQFKYFKHFFITRLIFLQWRAFLYKKQLSSSKNTGLGTFKRFNVE